MTARKKLLVILPTSQSRGIARQALELTQALSPDHLQSEIHVLDEAGSSGFVLNRFRNLRSTLKTWQPDVIHAWGLESLRWLFLCNWKKRCIASLDLTEVQRPSWLRPLDRCLIKQVNHVLCWSQAESEQCQSWGISPEKLILVAPGRQITEESKPISIPEMPENGRVILCAGRLEKHKGFQEAIWALHLLLYPIPNLHLVIAGDGPDRERLRQYAHDLEVSSHVHFVGAQANLRPWLARAEQVWSCSRRDSGSGVILEGMLAGKVVIANRWPTAREMIHDGETGCLTTPMDVSDFCRRAYPLFNDETSSREMGRQASQYAREHFNLRDTIEICEQVYLGAKVSREQAARAVA